jgi:hypothetical protein
MTSPTIRAALEAAGRELCPTGRASCGPCRPLCGHCARNAAAAVAAFLRALPDGVVLALLSAEQDRHRGWRDTLAAAVEEAAKDGG